MNIVRFIAIIGCSTLLQGLCYADQTGKNSPAPAKNGSGSQPKSALTSPVPVHDPFLVKPIGPSKKLTVENKIENNHPAPAKLPSFIPTTEQKPQPYRPHGTAPGVVGGPVSSTKKNTAVLNGTSVHNRTY